VCKAKFKAALKLIQVSVSIVAWKCISTAQTAAFYFIMLPEHAFGFARTTKATHLLPNPS